MNKGILVLAEVVNGKATMVTKELLGIGRKLSDGLKQELGVVVMGVGVDKTSSEMIALGADNVYLVEEAALAEQRPDVIAMVLVAACKQLNPFLTILGSTDIGRDVAPRLAATLGESFTTDCVGLGVAQDGASLLITRPLYGGKALAEYIAAPDAAQIVSMRSHSVPAAEPNASRQGKVTPLKLTLDIASSKLKLTNTVREEVKGIKLEEAEVVVSGGRGIGNAKSFDLLRELAQVLKGAVGSTKDPCDEGWVPANLKIGQTGVIVSPKLYIAVGISGAPQHTCGMVGSKCIVAVNNDPEANIFKVSDFGIVADYAEAVPVMISKFKALMAG